jgi:dienelactone hydrolase
MSDKLAAVAITGGGVAPNPGTPMPTADAAQRIRAPMLMLQGAGDRILPPDRSALLKSVLDRNHVPNDRQVFDGADNTLLGAKSAEVFRLIEAWFTKYDSLKAQTRTGTPGSPTATNPK